MSSLAGRTIATVGSGVMAEAIIAGLLRGQLVSPDQVVASHPRPDRREALTRTHGVRTVDGNAAAVAGADIVLLAIKPQMLTRVGREIRGDLRPGQLVISILAGATTQALIGHLGHQGFEGRGLGHRFPRWPGGTMVTITLPRPRPRTPAGP